MKTWEGVFTTFPSSKRAFGLRVWVFGFWRFEFWGFGFLVVKEVGYGNLGGVHFLASANSKAAPPLEKLCFVAVHLG